MAKTVKVLNGSISTTTTIYTVPAERNAAVTLAALVHIGGSSVNMTLGSVTALAVASNSTAPSAAVGGENTLVAAATPIGTTATAVYPRVTYLSTGQTVAFATLNGVVTYSMSVVEEY